MLFLNNNEQLVVITHIHYTVINVRNSLIIVIVYTLTSVSGSFGNIAMCMYIIVVQHQKGVDTNQSTLQDSTLIYKQSGMLVWSFMFYNVASKLIVSLV